MKTSKALFLFIVVLFYSCTQVTEQKEADKFVGLWSLYIMEQLNPETGEWNEWKNGIQGYILYDDQNNMAVHLTTKGYENTDLRFPNFTDSISTAALKHITGSYVYFAKYSVDEENRIVEHARLSHSNPGQWKQNVVRRFTFKGDTLTLEPLEEEVPERLIWVRAE